MKEFEKWFKKAEQDLFTIEASKKEHDDCSLYGPLSCCCRSVFHGGGAISLW